MSVTTISSREFNQDVSKAKRAAASGPVFITDRGHTAHVLLTIEEYAALRKDCVKTGYIVGRDETVYQATNAELLNFLKLKL